MITTKPRTPHLLLDLSWRRAILCLIFTLSLPSMLVARQQATTEYTISGTVTDKASGEELIGAIVRVAEIPKKGARCNKHGFYSLTLPQGSYTLIVQYVGYKSFTQKLLLNANTVQNVALEQVAQQSKEVVVTAERENENIASPQIGVEKVDLKDIKNIPVLLGERDILKTIQLLPGVKPAGEGNSGFSVRGGNTDQNLILLDEAPVYNASHLMGFFSTFNSDAIKDVTLYKGNMPAQYGGRTSSVLDVRMNEGNNKEYTVSGGIGLISSKLNVEGPIEQNNSSFLISARRTYADVFFPLFVSDSTQSPSLYFYDLNAKVNYKIGENDRIFLSGYFGRDVLGLRTNTGIDWGNATGTLRWNHIMGEKTFSNASLIYSSFSYDINTTIAGSELSIYSEIRDWNLKEEIEYFPDTEHSWLFGANIIYHTIVPGSITLTGDTLTTRFRDQQLRYALESAAYCTQSWEVASNLNLQWGLRFSMFNVLGGSDFYTLDAAGSVIDTTHYASGEIVKTFAYIEPRLSFSYLLNENSSLKGGYARSTQNLHLLSNSTTASPTDRWLPSSNIVNPEVVDQVSIGYFRNIDLDEQQGRLEISLESYYKYMQNQLDYKDGANLRNNAIPETELLFGKGRAYGLEFMLKKTQGDVTGWIAYTLARTERQIEGVNNNIWYPTRYDRTHDISLVLMYQLSPTWTLSANWVYYTGNAVTFPSGKYTIGKDVVFLYTERNAYRMPDYHRLDLGATWKLGEHSELNFSLYNAYGRENAYIIEFRESKSDPTKTEAVQTSLFRWVPSISWNFRY